MEVLANSISATSHENEIMSTFVSFGKRFLPNLKQDKRQSLHLRDAKRILQHLELGIVLGEGESSQLPDQDAWALIHSLDRDDNFVISPNELKQWLFRNKTLPGSSQPPEAQLGGVGPSKSTPTTPLSPSKLGNSGISSDEYTEVAARLRNALLQFGNRSEHEAKRLTKKIFSELDVDGHHELTRDDFIVFLSSPDLDVFDGLDETAKGVYAKTLIEQIDIDRNGTISLTELHDFLWRTGGRLEFGIVLVEAREEILRNLRGVTYETPDKLLLDAFVAFAK